MHRLNFLILILIFSFFTSINIQADDPLEELQIKRKNIFEFTKEPIITKTGDIFTIEFAVKDYCDATVAIQTLDGDILRHLASGVLGKNAPLPFKQNSLEQKISWDSKNDQGKYVDDLKNVNIRISLGLKPTYEKDLYTSPYKRITGMPAIAAGPEGLYVFEGYGRDHLMLFNHQGEYVKTIYPFPASQISNIKGLEWSSYGNREKAPLKYSAYQQTLLSSGNNGPTASGNSASYSGMLGKGATTISVQGSRLLLAFERINRLQTDGSTGNMEILGPAVGLDRNTNVNNKEKLIMGPNSSAFSPDGKTAYFTCYMWQYGYQSGQQSGSLPVVMKVNYESNEPAVVFAGNLLQDKFGSGPDQLNTPSSVDTDTNGNVYVSDFCNDRIQIFDPSGKLLKSLSTPKPSKVLVHKTTNEIYAFSYPILGVPTQIKREQKIDFNNIPKTLSTFSAYPELKTLSSDIFPLGNINRIEHTAQGNSAQIALDSWSKTPAIWIAVRKFEINEGDIGMHGHMGPIEKDWLNGPIRRLEKKDGKWEEVINFGKKVEKELVRPRPPAWNIQELYVNPKNKKLYIAEADSGPTNKAFSELIEVDPETGANKLVKLPYNPMDIAFDLDGFIYMRTMAVLGRFNMETWKEIPFDYGAELSKVGNDGGMGGSYSPLVSGLMLPATNAVCYHQGGLDVNANGDILVACHNRPTMNKNNVGVWGHQPMKAYTEYAPANYPGRLLSATSVCLHIWDKFGKVKAQDVLPGCPQTDGVFLDSENNIYIMAVVARQINNKPIDDGMTSTLMKFKASKGQFLTLGGENSLKLPPEKAPQRAKEVSGMWVNNFDWMYGGVGFIGNGPKSVGGGCVCWFARFKLDYFARSFAPEPLQYSVAVLDSNGNLITRIGRYGNLDSAGAKSKEPLGGDEVGLFHPCYVSTLSDKKVFISDIGNERIVSVKLNYYNEKILPAIK
jgi:hypothetical protein